MKIFPNFNQSGIPCPVCKTNTDKPCALIPIDGTQEGNKEQAILVHIDCIDLRYNKISEKTVEMFYQLF